MLWPHQETGIAAVHAAIDRGVRRILLTSPTGGGKSKIMANLAEDFLKQTKRVCIYTNRRLLVEQLSNTFNDHNLPHGIRSADYTTDHNMMLQISSVQTEDARVHKSQEWTLHDAQLILVDEAHLSKGPTYQKIFNAHAEANAVQVGFTATPLELETLYDELIVAGTNSELRKCGALVPCLHYGADEPDLRILKKKPADGEDFSENQIRQAMMNPTIYARVIEWFNRLNPERKPTILFAPGVNESLWFAEQFVKAGIPAGHIASDGVWMNGVWLPTSKPEEEKAAKKQLIEASRTGEICVITNRFLMREGLNLPWLEHAIFATMFGSLQTYLQVGGRILRSFPGKKHAIIQDHGGCLDTETEILTYRGWVGIDDMLDDDKIGTLNISNKRFEWNDNLGTIRKKIDDAMYQIQQPHLDIRVTGYHEMVMKADLRIPEWKKTKAAELSDRGSNWVIPTSAEEEVCPSRLTDHEIGFIGWYLTDGCLDKARIRIYQSTASPEMHHQHIIACLVGCGFRFSIKTRNRPSPFGGACGGETAYSISSGRKSPGGWDRLTSWLDKSFPLDQFNQLDRRQFGVLLEAMNLGDGLKQKNRCQKTKSLAVGKKAVADNIQSLAVRRGFRCNLATHVQGDTTIYILHIRDAESATVGKGDFIKSYTAHDERVWCVQTENGTIVTRRHGKVAIMGNSWHRHGSLNADRVWALNYTNSTVYAIRAERMREKRMEEPYRCPQCGLVVAQRNCPCGFVCPPRRSRPVVQFDGTLKEHTGDIFKPRRVSKNPNGPKIWEKMYHRSRTEKGQRTFRAAAALFARENNFQWPDKNWPFMPVDELDWFRLVSDIPRDRLTGGYA